MKSTYLIGDFRFHPMAPPPGKNGVRFNWNVLPVTRLECSQIPVPIGCLVTPFSKTETPQPLVGTNLILCRHCRGYMNPFVEVAETKEYWQCSFCNKRSFFATDNKSLPTQEYVEGVLGETNNGFAGGVECHVFVIDKYQHVDELEEMKSLNSSTDSSSGNYWDQTSFGSLIAEISAAIDDIPDDSFVSFILYDENVHITSIDEIEGKSSYPFSFGLEDEIFEKISFKELENFYKEDSAIAKAIETKLGLQNSIEKQSDLNGSPLVIKVNETTRPIIKLFLKLIKPTLTHSFKPTRVLGLSLYTLSLVFSRYIDFRGQVYIFTSGPNTTNPGIILNEGDSLRSHHDIKELNSNSNFKKTLKFYEMLAFVANGVNLSKAGKFLNSLNKRTTTFEPNVKAAKWTYHLFSGSLDQVGLYEMKPLSQITNGVVSIAQSFKDRHFKEQFRKTFRQQVNESMSNVTLTVYTLQNLKISRMISQGYHLPSNLSEEQHQEKISDHLGVFDSSLKKKYFTNRWYWNLMAPTDTIGLFFEVEGTKSSFNLAEEFKVIQLVWKYWDKRIGKWMIRINTVRRETTTRARDKNQVKNLELNLNNAKIDMVNSIDPETFAALFARLILNKLDTNLGYDFEGATSVIDSTIVQLLYNFDRSSVKTGVINETIAKVTNIIYHLRRNNQIVQVFNSSPDETTYYHYWFLKFGTELSTLAIVPKVYKLKPCQEPVEIQLNCDTFEQEPQNAKFVVDSGFSVIIYNHFVDAKDKLPLHHSNNDDLIDSEVFKQEFALIKELGINLRPIVPRYIITQTNHSQSRFLILRLSPKKPVVTSVRVDEEPRLWIALLFSKTGSQKTATLNYDISKTDEICYEDYCEGLIQMVEKVKLN